MGVAGAVSTPATLGELLDLDLEGRPFLQEQGNTVTRGFVRFLEVDEDHWTLAIRDVEYLDKRKGLWAPDTPEDEYGGRAEHTAVSRLWGGQPPIFDRGVQISCYGIFIHIGVRSDRPWRDNDWPELDTELLSPGPMSDGQDRC